MWIPYNPNLIQQHGNDCTVRAISTITGLDWMSVYLGLCVEGAMQQDMPSTNAVWGSWLRRHGFRCSGIPNMCPDCYTVKDFCRDFPEGEYLLAVPGHVVCVIDGDYYDAWDSGSQTALFYWSREE